MSLKCEYCPKSFDGLNRENINRHNNKHINKKHQKITNIKPINSFLNQMNSPSDQKNEKSLT